MTVAQKFYQTLNVSFACDAVLFDDEIWTTIALLTTKEVNSIIS
jgi:hypothetical protein